MTGSGTTHLLIDQIAEFLPSEMTGHIDFEQSSIHFIHFCILGECRLGEEYVSNFILDVDVPLEGIQEHLAGYAPLNPCKL